MPRWSEVEIPAPAMRRAAEQRGIAPIRQYVTEFDTNDATQRAAFFRLLHNPLPVLVGQVEGKDLSEDEAVELEGLVLAGVQPHWKVVTTLRNHHRGLNPRINLSSMTVSEEEETVYHDVYKQLD
jgi:hypothetical protein